MSHTTRGSTTSKPSQEELPRDRFAVEEILQLAFGPQAVLAAAVQPVVKSPVERKAVMLRQFIEQIDWDQAEADIETLQELQMIINRRNQDETSGALGRVIELLENLTDTAESCGLK